MFLFPLYSSIYLLACFSKKEEETAWNRVGGNIGMISSVEEKYDRDLLGENDFFQ